LVGIARRQAAWRQTQAVLDQIAAWRARVAANLARLTYELQREILRAMDVRVTLWPAGHEPRYLIEASIPLGDGHIDEGADPAAGGHDAIMSVTTA
jgi:hypothetical protein